MEQADREIFHQGLRDATAARTGAPLDAALVDLGWHDALAVDPRAAISMLFECQGSANSTSSALDDLIVATLGLDTGQRSAVVLPASDRWDPPGRFQGARLFVSGLGTGRVDDAESDTVIIIAGSDGTDLAVETKAGDLTRLPVRGMDPWMGLAQVTAIIDSPSRDTSLAAGSWLAATKMAQLALGHELLGAAQAMGELARTYALERIQFGRPISAFQAVRHRLAETLVATEATGATLAAAWDDPSPQAPAIAKALAGRNARTAARHCQQVLAGMGFTTEHPLHRYIRRVMVLDDLFGSSRSLTAALGREIIAHRRAPTPLDL